MKSSKRGPTRGQLTDEQWERVCNLFETIDRIVKRHAGLLRPLAVQGGQGE